MASYTTESIRNVALVGNGGAGKTLLAEALLHQAGALQAMGEIARGTTVCDYEPEERQHQHSLSSTVASLDYNGVHVNLIDTPGYPDFVGRALSVLPAVETAVVVINAKSGVETNARRMMQAAADRGLCRMVVINRIDEEEVQLEAVFEDVVSSFGPECLPLNLPAGNGQSVVDCFLNKGEGDTDFSSVEDAHTQLVDQVVEVDEDLMELYLEQGEDLEAARLHGAFEQALREGHLVPVVFCSAATGAGIGDLLEILCELMPSPIEGNPAQFVREGADDPVQLEGGPEGPVVAHVFKVAIDAFVGRLGVLRIHQGTVTPNSALFVGDARKPFKVGHLFALQGKEHVAIESGIPGDICAIAKIDELVYDIVVHDEHGDESLRMSPMPLPAPMFGLAIDTKNRGDEQKLSDGLGKLSAEDPCFKVEHNTVLNETVAKGLGDLHLRVMLEKMRDRYNVEVDTRQPRIEYRETIRKAADGHHRHKKQTGGAGQFGEVYIKVEPMERGSGFEFVDEVVGGVIPHQFIPAVEKGIRQVLNDGAIAGYPLQDVRVRLYDGKFHAVDSKEIAFITAGKKAFLSAVSKASPIVLEPIVDIDVTVPQDNMGDITGDLSSKRGRISGTEALAGGYVTVSGKAPLSELGTYQSELKSVTGGAGTYAMQYSHYDPVPPLIQQQLAADFNPAADED